ncbi:MAG: prepilin-type N-terminal cleavage/methylation domain-containing protein [Nibricoccus sp.]
MKTSLSRSLRRGFTLSEVMVAMTIGAAIAGTATWFMVEGARISYKTTNTSINDLSQWSIFTAISVDTKVANGMAIYASFLQPDIADDTKRLNKDQRGQVLILTRSHQDQNSKKSVYDLITGYVYASSTKTLRKFQYVVTAAEQGANPATLEEILNNNYTNFTFTKVATDLTAVDSAGVFLVRQKGQSGILTVESAQGSGNAQVISKKLIEASFFIRG